MDIADQAQQFERINLEQSLKVQRAASKNAARFVPRGYCLNGECGEPFDNGAPARLYCGPQCADKHERQLRLMTNRK